jgi:uncharacterized membrane protein YdjX (TVP38/TMEM64 family)
VRRHQAHLLNYMLFLRATPILPGWFISLASPMVGVPFHTFFIASLVGHQPLNFITVQVCIVCCACVCVLGGGGFLFKE